MRKATRTFNLNDEDDAAILRDRERRGQPVLRPFESMRVPLQMMDSVDNSRATIERAKGATYRAGEKLGLHNRPDARITDGAGNGGLALHRPGYRIADGVPRDYSHYAAYEAELASAHRNVGASEREFTGGRVDDVGGGRSGTEGSACVADNNPSGLRLTFESWMGFPSDWMHASLAHANRNFHHSQGR